MAKKNIDAKKNITKRTQASVGMLSSNLVKPRVTAENNRRKPEIVSSTPTQADSGIVTVVPDTVSVQRKADRTRRTVALRKKLIISDTDDPDSSIQDDVQKLPSMESIQAGNDSTRKLFLSEDILIKWKHPDISFS